ncbi:MAG: presenilin family intramembrane aspartyl protease [Nanoarchaeota archaeon]
MKHTISVTFMLVMLFFVAQVVGLLVTNGYIDHEATKETGKVMFVNLPYDIERPPMDEKSSFVFIITAVIIGTLLVLLLVKFKRTFLWKVWFFLAVVLCLSISFSAFMNAYLAFVISILLAVYKIFRPNVIIHNLTEIFVYGGLAAIFVPVMNVFAVIMLLIFISIYDFIAVFKIKHMITMAKFQTDSKVFAGLLIPYKGAKSEVKSKKKVKGVSVVRTAILGGGDIGFPLLFAGVVMKGLIIDNGFLFGFLKSLIIPVFTSFALLFLLTKGQKDKFYPAMPILSVGCLLGYAVVLLINLV